MDCLTAVWRAELGKIMVSFAESNFESDRTQRCDLNGVRLISGGGWIDGGQQRWLLSF